MLTLLDTDKEFELPGDLSKMITFKNYNVDLDKLSDQKILFDFAKEMYFDKRALGIKSTSDKSLVTLHKSPAVVVSGISAISLPEAPNELCNKLNLLLQGKKAGNKSNIIN